jgi:hypothetical protein
MINPNAYKLGISKFWLNKLPGKTAFLYVFVNRILSVFFSARRMQMKSYIYSHVLLKNNFNKYICIDVYIYFHGRFLQRRRRKLKYNVLRRLFFKLAQSSSIFFLLRSKYSKNIFQVIRVLQSKLLSLISLVRNSGKKNLNKFLFRLFLNFLIIRRIIVPMRRFYVYEFALRKN